MPRFKSIIFYQTSPKIELFLKKKCEIFKRWGLRPQTPKTAPQLRISGYAPAALCTINILVFLAFVLNNFFLINQLQTL